MDAYKDVDEHGKDNDEDIYDYQDMVEAAAMAPVTTDTTAERLSLDDNAAEDNNKEVTVQDGSNNNKAKGCRGTSNNTDHTITHPHTMRVGQHGTLPLQRMQTLKMTPPSKMTMLRRRLVDAPQKQTKRPAPPLQ